MHVHYCCIIVVLHIHSVSTVPRCRSSVHFTLCRGEIVSLIGHQILPTWSICLFLVANTFWGWCSVIDSASNQYLQVEHFNFETPCLIIQTLWPGKWVTFIEIQEEYFHISVYCYFSFSVVYPPLYHGVQSGMSPHSYSCIFSACWVSVCKLHLYLCIWTPIIPHLHLS